MADPRFPDQLVTVELSGPSGNAFAIIGNVKQAMRASGAEDEEVKQFTEEAMSGDYDNVLATARKWVTLVIV